MLVKNVGKEPTGDVKVGNGDSVAGDEEFGGELFFELLGHLFGFFGQDAYLLF